MGQEFANSMYSSSLSSSSTASSSSSPYDCYQENELDIDEPLPKWVMTKMMMTATPPPPSPSTTSDRVVVIPMPEVLPSSLEEEMEVEAVVNIVNDERTWERFYAMLMMESLSSDDESQRLPPPSSQSSPSSSSSMSTMTYREFIDFCIANEEKESSLSLSNSSSSWINRLLVITFQQGL